MFISSRQKYSVSHRRCPRWMVNRGKCPVAEMLAVNLISLLLMFATSCTSTVPVDDISTTVGIHPILNSHDEHVAAPVWLNNDTLFVPLDRPALLEGGQLYNLQSELEQPLKINLGLPCYHGEFRSWARIADDRLGFIYECRDENLRLVGNYLIVYDVRTQQHEILQKYSVNTFNPGAADDFAVAPGMDEVVQETTGGHILHRLYRLSLEDDQITQLVPDFYRAGSPTWSPDGSRLAFAGNPSGPRLFPSLLGSLNLANEIYAPWDLYLMDKDGSRVTKVLSDVKFMDTVKWSPRNENLIAFRGKYGEQLGLWLFDLTTTSLTFVWPESEAIRTRFDWSPDGSQLVVLSCHAKSKEPEAILERTCRILILTLPEGFI